MNKVYRVIFNHATQTWTAVSELAKGRTKTKSEKVATAAAAVSLVLASGGAYAATQILDGQLTRTSADGGSIIINESISGGQNVIIGSRLVGNVSSSTVQSIVIGNDVSMTDGRGSIAIGGDDAHSAGGLGTVGGQNFLNVAREAGGFDTNGYRKLSVSGAGAVGIGTFAVATGKGATALGLGSTASVEGATSVGTLAFSTGTGSSAFGLASRAEGSNTLALGAGARATQAGSIALGAGSVTTNGVAVTSSGQKYQIAGTTYDPITNTNYDVNNVVSVGNATVKRQIQNVAPGQITATSTDAINGSQLYAITAGVQQVINNHIQNINQNINNSGFNLQDNAGTKVAEVNKDDNLTFKNGNLTTSNVTANREVSFDVVTQNINVANGVPTEAGTTTGVATAKTVADAIKNSGFNLQANGQNGSLIKPGDTVSINSGDNTEVIKSGNTITVHANKAEVTATASDIKLDTKVTGRTTAYNISLADTVKQDIAKGVDAKTAVDKGFNVTSDSGTLISRQLGDTVAITGGNGTGSFVATNVKTVNTATGVQVQFAENPEFKDITATSIKTGDNVLNGTGLTIGTASITNAGGINAGNKPITNVASGGDTGTNAANIDDVKRLAAAADTTASTSGTNGIEVVKTTVNGKTTDYQVGLTKATQDEIAKGQEALTAINTGIYAFDGDDNTTTGDAPTGNITFVGGDNINTVAGLVSGKPAVTINLDPNIVVDNVTVGTVQISKDGGINAGDKTITGVANATNANDAVNLSQLNATKVSVVGGANITSVDTKVTDNGTTYTINAKDTSATVSNASTAVTVTANGTTNGVTDFAVDLSETTKANLTKASTALQNVTGKDGITAEKQGDTVTVGLDDATKANLTKANTAVQTVTGSNGITATKTADGYDVSLNEATQANLTKANTAVQEIKTTVNGQAVKTLNQTNNTQNFVNGDNISITNDSGSIKISTNPDVVFENVTVGTVQISKDEGINAGNKTIQGVANGQNNNDAVNVSQLNEVKNALQAGTQNYFHTNTGNNIGGDPETNHGAVGQSAGATALNSLAAGINAKATAEGASAVGHGAVASGQAASAIGQDSKAEGVNSVAIGIRSEALGLGSLALGETSKAHGEKALAWGGEAQAMERMTVAIGDRAIADKQYAFAMGAQSRANADYSVVVGTNAEAKETAQFGTAIGKSAIVTGSHSTAIGVDSQSVGSDSIALGRQANSTGVSTVALGHSAATKQNNAIAVGSNSIADGANSIAVGRNASTQQDNSIALGTNAKSQAVSAVAIGNAANVTGINAVGVGYNSSVKNLSGSAFGRDSSVSSDYGTALGANAVVGENLPSSVALGAHSEVRAGTPTTKAEVNGYTYTGFAGTNIAHNSGANSKVVSVGSVGSERQIQNVAAGQITATSTDAINGSQLFRVIERVESGKNFTGNTGDTTNLRFGETLNIAGDATTQGTYSSANIKTVMTDNNTGGVLKIQIADNPEFKDITATSIKTGDNVLNGTGLTIGTASITNADGINAGNKTIQGVANATANDEAVNLAQLKAQSVTVKAGQNVNSVNEVKTDDGITYTIDAKDTTVSKGSDAVTVEKGAETNGVTDYKVDLSAESKESLAKADTAVQDVKGQGGITATKGADNVVTVDLDEATKANLTKANTAVQEIKTTVNGQTVKTLTKNDNTQNFVNGDNIEISNDGGSIKVSTAKEVTFDKVTVGTASIDKDAGINAGDKRVQGVADGTADKDAVNVSQLRDNVTTINNNIDAAKTELTNKGLDFTADSGNTVHRNLGQAVAITGGNGQGAFSASNVKTVTTENGVQVQFSENPNFTTVTTTGAITAGGMLNAGGGLTVAGGQTVQMGNNRVQGVANAVESTDAVNLSQLNATKVSVVGGANITSIDSKVTDNGTTYTINAKDTSATVSSANEKALKVTQGAENNGITDFALDLGDDTKASLAKADSSVQSIVNKVNGQAVNTLTKNANEQDFVNGDNIIISDDNGAIKVATASNVVFDNVTVGGVKISKDEGVNAGDKRIQGVANGAVNATSTDAINGSQLFQATNDLNTKIDTKTQTYFHTNNGTNTGGDASSNLGSVEQSAGATALNSLAAGIDAKATAERASAVGYNANASGGESTAIGVHAVASGGESTAIGVHAVASGWESNAIGVHAVASGRESNAIGVHAVASGRSTNAIGFGAEAKGDFSLAFGTDSVANEAYSIAVGYGTRSEADRAIALGHGAVAKSTADDGIAIGNTAAVSARDGIAIGKTSKSSGVESIAMGYDADSRGQKAVAIGKAAFATRDNAVAVGHAAQAYAEKAVAIGNDTIANSENGVVLGAGASIGENLASAVALGAGSVARASTAVTKAEVNGYSYTGFAASAVEAGKVVSVGREGSERQIQNVAAGQITATSTDAINGSQLFRVIERVESGKNFTGNEGNTTNLRFGETLNIAGDATTQGTYSSANIKTVMTDNDAGGALKIQIAENPEFKDITATSIKTGDNVLNGTGLTIGTASITNADGINAGNKTIQGVANATKDDEAVNLSQLNATKDAINTEIAKGLNFSADSGDTVNRKLGDTLAITGGNGQGDYSTTNVRTITTTNGVEIQLADNPTFNNVKANDVQTATLTTTGTATIGGMLNANGGLTVAGGQTVQMGNNRVQGVANAVESTDAVNLSQLNATKVSVVGGANITSIDSKVTDNGTTYTINAKDTSATVSTADEKALTVTKGTETNGITNFEVALGEDTKASLAKADTAVQDVKGQGGITATKGADNVVTVDLDDATKANLTKADTAVQEIETQIDGKTVKTVKKGDNTANFITGDNIELTDENGAIKVATKKDVTFTNVNTDTLTATTGTIGTLTSTTINNAGAINTQTLATTGTATIGGMLNANGGLTVANGQTVNMGNNTISNVASGGDVGTNAANIDDVKRLAKSADTTASTSGTNGIEVLKVEQNGQVTDYQVGLTQATRDDIAKGVQASDDVANKGLTFTGDTGETTAKKLGDSLAITGDDNISTTATANGVAISLNRNLTADSLSIGNVVIDNAGINAGNQVISNVANGVADNDAVNVAQLKANSVKVLAGANITSVESQVTPNGTTYTINAKDTSASVSAASNALTVKAGEQNNGVIDYAIDLSDDIKASLNKANTGVQTVNGKDGITTEKQGDTVTVGLDDATKASLAKADTAVQVVNGKNGITATKTDNGYDVELDENTKDSLAKADTAVQNITTKVNGKEVKTLNQADNSQDFVDGDNITITNDNGAIKVATKKDVNFDNVQTATLSTTGNATVGGTLTANGGLTVANGQTVNMGNNRIQDVANGVADTDAVNVAQLNNATKALNDNINTAVNNTGWTVKANGDNGQKVANNGEVNFVQGDNIIIERSGTDITVKTTDNPNFKQVTAQSIQATTVNATTVNTDAVNAKSVQADTVKTTGDVTVGGTLTANGGLTVAAGQPINMGGNVVNGVAPAEISPSSTQAVNGAQIYELQQGINRANAQLNDRITGVEESAYGGTASAIATGLLPQAFNPGESLGGVAVGTYKGASAVAVGFSSISDNGKYIFRLAGGATSTGDYSGGAAIGVKFR